MPINRPYRGPDELPALIPLFPLDGALLLPRCQLPLNIFEPRYLAMVDDALKGERLVGMVQPDPDANTVAVPSLADVGCVGRITEVAESGDGRYLMNLTGVARFRIVRELGVLTPYRQAQVVYAFADDFVPNTGADAVDRTGLLRTFAEYLKARNLEADWESVNEAPNEALVNGLSMMAPFGPREKQALLEAADLKTRAEILVAVTEMALARTTGEGEGPLQ
ncbi:MAG: peptidase lon domain protein [Xanthobacteraceae bacterium]|jgi:Lon protease-like protein|nr:peptidase lon domain protein [Xanthobacteraceae bacterium]